MSKNSSLESAVRRLFNSGPFDRLISEGLPSIHGNSNGTVYCKLRDGSNVFLDKNYTLSNPGKELLESVVGSCTPENSVLEMDVEVNGEGFCLTLIGPPASDGWTWTVACRDSLRREATREIAARIDLDDTDAIFNSVRAVDQGPTNSEREGAYRRGYHQAVAAVADALRRGSVSADELATWVDGSGMRWRKDVTLDRQIVPPSVG